MKAIFEELAHIKDSLGQLKRAGGKIGDKPLIVLTAGKPLTAEEAGLTKLDLDKMEMGWNELQKDFAYKSDNSKQIIAEKSDHMIPFYQPEIIVKAVYDMSIECNQRLLLQS